MIKFRNQVLGSPEEPPVNVEAGRAARGYGEQKQDVNNVATTAATTPVSKVQPVSTEPRVNGATQTTSVATTSAKPPAAATNLIRRRTNR